MHIFAIETSVTACWRRFTAYALPPLPMRLDTRATSSSGLSQLTTYFRRVVVNITVLRWSPTYAKYLPFHR